MAETDTPPNPIPPKTILDKMWSWGVVSAASILLLGGGFSCMTSPHKFIADGFFIAGILLLLVKFWTWEETKQKSRKKRVAWITVSTISALGLILAACSLTNYMNGPQISASEKAANNQGDSSSHSPQPTNPKRASSTPPPPNRRPQRKQVIPPSSQVEPAPNPSASAQPQQPATQSVGGVDCTANSGNCAGINNGQQITNQFAEPPANVHFTQESSDSYGAPAKVLSITVDHTLAYPAFLISCNVPCHFDEDPVAGGIGTDVERLEAAGSPNIIGFVLSSPRPLGQGVPIRAIVVPNSTSPITVNDVQIAKEGDIHRANK